MQRQRSCLGPCDGVDILPRGVSLCGLFPWGRCEDVAWDRGFWEEVGDTVVCGPERGPVGVGVGKELFAGGQI